MKRLTIVIRKRTEKNQKNQLLQRKRKMIMAQTQLNLKKGKRMMVRPMMVPPISLLKMTRKTILRKMNQRKIKSLTKSQRKTGKKKTTIVRMIKRSKT